MSVRPGAALTDHCGKIDRHDTGQRHIPVRGEDAVSHKRSAQLGASVLRYFVDGVTACTNRSRSSTATSRPWGKAGNGARSSSGGSRSVIKVVFVDSEQGELAADGGLHRRTMTRCSSVPSKGSLEGGFLG